MAKEETTETVAERPKSLAELAGGMGKKLELIEGNQVVVTAIAFENREVRALKDSEPDAEVAYKEGDLISKACAFITLDDGEVYYTWSEPLIEKLGRIKPEDLPAFGIFLRQDIPGGRRAWTIQ